jgi:hypothetical protein
MGESIPICVSGLGELPRRPIGFSLMSASMRAIPAMSRSGSDGAKQRPKSKKRTQEAIALLHRGPMEWNEWRRSLGSGVPSLRRVDLRGLKAKSGDSYSLAGGIDLRRIDLRRAELASASIQGELSAAFSSYHLSCSRITSSGRQARALSWGLPPRS